MSAEPVGWKVYDGSTFREFIPNEVPGARDEFGEHLIEQMKDPEFRAAYETAERHHRRAYPGALAVDGHAYQRRLKARRRRRR